MNTARVVFRLLCVGILIAAIVQITTRAHAEADKPHHEPAKVDHAAVASMLEEVEAKKQLLDKRAQELSELESRIKDREKELDGKVKEMERLRAAVSGELEEQRKGGEERVVKMVAVFETMTPKSAANVLETLDDWLSVEVLKRMDIKRVAKVMNLMDKNRSAKLSELMTGYYNPEAKREISSIRNSRQRSDDLPQDRAGQAVKSAAAPQQAVEDPNLKKGETKPNEQSTRSR